MTYNLTAKNSMTYRLHAPSMRSVAVRASDAGGAIQAQRRPSRRKRREPPARDLTEVDVSKPFTGSPTSPNIEDFGFKTTGKREAEPGAQSFEAQQSSILDVLATAADHGVRGESLHAMELVLNSIRGLATDGTVYPVVAVLTMRSRSCLALGDPATALLDAAAALLLNPASEDAWAAYALALEALDAPQPLCHRATSAAEASLLRGAAVADEADMISPPPQGTLEAARAAETVLAPERDRAAALLSACMAAAAASTDCAEPEFEGTDDELEAAISRAIEAGDHAASRRYWTQMLTRDSVGDLTELLSLCLTQLGYHAAEAHSAHAALAADAAALRLQASPAALGDHAALRLRVAAAAAHLGLADASEKIMEAPFEHGIGTDTQIAQEQVEEMLETLREEVDTIAAVPDVLSGEEAVYAFTDMNFLPDMVTPAVELADAGGERVLRAICDLPKHSLITVCAPLAISRRPPDGGADGGNREEEEAFRVTAPQADAATALTENLVERAAHEPLVATALAVLAGDAGVKPPPLPAQLLERWSPRVLPMLPPWTPYFPAAENFSLAPEAATRLAATRATAYDAGDGGIDMSLYPLLSYLLQPLPGAQGAATAAAADALNANCHVFVAKVDSPRPPSEEGEEGQGVEGEWVGRYTLSAMTARAVAADEVLHAEGIEAGIGEGGKQG